MKATIVKLYTSNGQEIGSILTATILTKSSYEKKIIEEKLGWHCCNVLYHGKSLIIYSDLHDDAPRVIAIKDIDNLPSKDVLI